MHNWDSRYAERVKLLVEILPVLAGEKRFAVTLAGIELAHRIRKGQHLSR
jgi:hypothetical protein